MMSGGVCNDVMYKSLYIYKYVLTWEHRSMVSSTVRVPSASRTTAVETHIHTPRLIARPHQHMYTHHQ